MKRLLMLLTVCALSITSCHDDDIDNGGLSGHKWVQTSGPSGGMVYDITSDGTHSFAATASGIYRSNDNGVSWVGVRNGMSKFDCRSVVISGTNVFAVSSYGGVYRSANYGDSWTSVNNQGATKLVLSGNKLYSVGVNGVNVTTDNGNTWSALNNGLGVAVNSLTALAVNGNNLLVGSNSYGVFLSTDGGAHWSESNNGLTSKAVLVVMSKGANLFVGTGDGAFISTDNGANWNLITTIHTPSASEDNIWSFYASGTAMFACTNGGGIFRSDDNGLSWSASNTGLVSSWISALTSCGSKLLAASIGDGVFASIDNGNTWSASTEGIADIGNQLFVNGNNIYVITNQSQNSSTHFASLYKTADNGAHWTPQNLPAGIDSAIGGIAFSGSYFFMGGFGYGHNGIYRSSDNGDNWVQVGLSSNQVLQIQADGSTILAGTDNGVFLSTDYGDSWTSLASKGVPGGTANALAITNTKIIVVTGGRFYRSLDNGASFTSVLTPGLVTTLHVKGDRIFVGTNGSGLYKSDNNGDSWEAANNGLLDSHIASIVSNNLSVFTADFSGNVFRSDDNGLHWTNMSEDLITEYFTLTSLAIKDNYIYAGTGYGVWKREL